MTLDPRLNDLLEGVRVRWRRFRDLPSRWQAAALCGAALGAVGIALLVAALAGGDGDGSGNTAPPGRTATPATPTATPTPAATPAPTPTPLPPPVAGAYQLTQVLPVANFDNMLEFAVIPGEDSAVVITRDGRLWKVPLGGEAATPFGDVSGLLADSSHSEEGLLALAFPPDYQSSGRLYLYYTTGSPGPSILSRFQVAGDGTLDEASEEVLLEVPQPYRNHNGGQLLFGPDGYLYLSLGDGGGGGDPEETGQDPTDLLGSILRIDVSGSGFTVPADNPFAGNPVFAYGLRNPWRFSFDRETGEMWAGDVGQGEWEEVDRVQAGGNYGWDCFEGFESYEPAGCPSSGLIEPRAAYSHDDGSCSVTGGYVYRGRSMPELDGWYVYGDYCSGKVWAVNTADSSEPVLLVDTDLPIASFGEMPDGELLAITFANAVYRLARR